MDIITANEARQQILDKQEKIKTEAAEKAKREQEARFNQIKKFINEAIVRAINSLRSSVSVEVNTPIPQKLVNELREKGYTVERIKEHPILDIIFSIDKYYIEEKKYRYIISW